MQYIVTRILNMQIDWKLKKKLLSPVHQAAYVVKITILMGKKKLIFNVITYNGMQYDIDEILHEL